VKGVKNAWGGLSTLEQSCIACGSRPGLINDGGMLFCRQCYR
jgi:ribosomal protein S14